MATCAECRYYLPSPGWRYVSDPIQKDYLKTAGQCRVTLPDDDDDPATDAGKVVRSFSLACQKFCPSTQRRGVSNV